MARLMDEQPRADLTACQVVLRDSRRSFDRAYTYQIPPSLAGQITIGCRVEVPFGSGNRPAEAFVTALVPREDIDFQIKPLSGLLSPGPVLLPDQLRLAARMRRRYLCTHGDAIRCMVPAAVVSTGDKMVRMVSLCDEEDAAQRLADGELDRVGQIRVIELLLDCEQAPLQEVLRACQVSRSVIKTLEKKELVTVSDQAVRRQLDADDAEPEARPFQPTADQVRVIDRVSRSMRECSADLTSCQEFVLFGVTGSGKTEVYLNLAEQTLQLGRSVIILVPEISLTPQMISRIRARFGAAVAVLHSRLTPAERYEQWQRIIRQEIHLVVGARSAVFAPLRDIGLIILDEEQESTYKSETHPRYHARDIARMRVQEHGGLLVLGSATPSVESMVRCESGQATLLELPLRIGAAGMARAEIIDMRQELRDGHRSVFSRALESALRQAFSAGEQAILFINRRGYASFILCRECGHVVKCSSCSVSMTLHQNQHAPAGSAAREQLVCHYCGRVSRPPTSCPVCHSRLIGRFGVGTQQIEELFHQAFPEARALRMDQDTTSGRHAHARILQAFADHQADVLIGTQMIAKGHDFPNVSVVGILSADQLLGLSDFRAGERAFQLMTQAAGRAGRGDIQGRVMIQSYNMDDYAIRHAAEQDFAGFYAQEKRFRKAMGYPPYGSVACLTLSAPLEEDASTACRRLASALRARLEENGDFAGIDLMAPARAPMYRIKDRYRWRLILKGPAQDLINQMIMPVLDHFPFGRVAVALDYDPYQLL
ncbi:MAG: primosomal protein N' [Eubacteriales bacterium]|nr:primosomal protein N' [Eubacteriales bacterium]